LGRGGGGGVSLPGARIQLLTWHLPWLAADVDADVTGLGATSPPKAHMLPRTSGPTALPTGLCPSPLRAAVLGVTGGDQLCATCTQVPPFMAPCVPWRAGLQLLATEINLGIRRLSLGAERE